MGKKEIEKYKRAREFIKKYEALCLKYMIVVIEKEEEGFALDKCSYIKGDIELMIMEIEKNLKEDEEYEEYEKVRKIEERDKKIFKNRKDAEKVMQEGDILRLIEHVGFYIIKKENLRSTCCNALSVKKGGKKKGSTYWFVCTKCNNTAEIEKGDIEKYLGMRFSDLMKEFDEANK